MKKKFVEVALAYFREGGWNGREMLMKRLKAAKTAKDVWCAVYYAAEQIGNRKGYGEEGKGELHSEFLDEIAKRCGISCDSEMFIKVK